MDYVPLAVPFFLLLILLELGWGLWRNNNTYRTNDAINSLSLGSINTLIKLVVLDVSLIIFEGTSNRYGLFDWNASSIWAWLAGWLAYDFCYYWFHRVSHERQFFWAGHVVHHQSEDFNLSTALRQTGTGFFFSWVFYVPLFFLGMPIEMYITIVSLHLIYQFWVHTQHVHKLGPLEWLLVTPSNHRGHHAQNPRYVDKNYGGLLIIWDRLFGTYAEEVDDEPILYGITSPLQSWNPLWANTHVYWGMLQDIHRTKRWRDKLKVPFARTGWQPDDVAEHWPREKVELTTFKKFDPPLNRSAMMLSLFQYLLVIAGYGVIVLQAADQGWLVNLWGVGYLVFQLFCIGLLLEGKASLLTWSGLRFVFGLAGSLSLLQLDHLGPSTLQLVFGYVFASFAIDLVASKVQSKSEALSA